MRDVQIKHFISAERAVTTSQKYNPFNLFNFRTINSLRLTTANPNRADVFLLSQARKLKQRKVDHVPKRHIVKGRIRTLSIIFSLGK